MAKTIALQIFFLIFFCYFSQEAVRFGTLVLFAFADRGCVLLCRGSSCLSSEDLVSPVYLQESVPSFICLRVYKVSQYVGVFFFTQKTQIQTTLQSKFKPYFTSLLFASSFLGEEVGGEGCILVVVCIKPYNTASGMSTGFPPRPACSLNDTRRWSTK